MGSDQHVPRGHEVGDFLRRVFSKAEEDNVFFMAGAISFNLLVAIVPLLLLSVGISGIVLSARFGDPSAVLLSQLQEALPQVGGDIDLVRVVEDGIDRLLAERTGLSILGAVAFIWFSTRLVGTLRTVLREVFDVAQERGIVEGKLFDAFIVVVGGFLVLVNVGVTVVVRAVRDFGVDLLGLEGFGLRLTHLVVGQVLAFLSIWTLFVLIYRYLPLRRIPWRTSLVAATFAAVAFELLKVAFSWYVTEVATYSTTYGNLATAAILFFWLYYNAIAFVIGGEVAQVYTMRWARKVETEKALSTSG